MQYQFVFLIDPPDVFGLPTDGTAVVPSDGIERHGPTLDSRTGNFVSHGTLSRFRDDELHHAITVDSVEFSFRDNFAFLSFQEQSNSEAITRAVRVATKLCQILSVESQRYFSFRIVQATTEPDGFRVPLPHIAKLANISFYNIDQLKSWLSEAQNLYQNDDLRLEQALAYYHHAMRMFADIHALENIAAWAGNMLSSETILNFYMSASTILGDPSRDKDYQSRYRSYGISRELWEDVERLRKVRNDEGVAHYSLETDRLETLAAHLQFAKKTASAVLMAYMSHPAS